LGQQENADNKQAPSYVSDCYLCPGNKRVGGFHVNPQYEKCFVFENDFPAVKAIQPEYDPEAMVKSVSHVEKDVLEKMQILFKAQGVRGCARVICFSPFHHLTMAEMQVLDIVNIIKEWINQIHDLSKLDYVNYVQLFVSMVVL
jgi:UDPglucose--hexose-1-phosphate uridylyltransferase